MMGALSLFPSIEDKDRERGRALSKDKRDKSATRPLSSSIHEDNQGSDSRASSRARSQSPFFFRRSRPPSPTVDALAHSDVESDTESLRPRNAYGHSDDDSGDETETEYSDDSWSDDQFDPVTERNTERNALVLPETGEGDVVDIADPLGEGVNVVIPPEPYFPTTLNANSRNPRRRKSTKQQDRLLLDTSRPVFQRDRCTITVTHGDPANALNLSGRKKKRYLLASDLSDESRFALEWGIGTVLRDGDEMCALPVLIAPILV
jgi:hypothetical protein